MKKKEYGIHIADHHDKTVRSKYIGKSINMEDEQKAKGQNWRCSGGETFLVHGHKKDEQETTSENRQCTEGETLSIPAHAEDKNEADSDTGSTPEMRYFHPSKITSKLRLMLKLRLKLKQRKLAKKDIIVWATTILIAIGLAFVLNVSVIQLYMIAGGSMKPTIMPGDCVLGNKFIYRFHDPRPGDVIVFKPPVAAYGGDYPANEVGNSHFGLLGDNNKVVPFLKRVVAVEGDTVEIRGGVVYVNNLSLNEPYIMDTSNYTIPLERVPKGKLFVLGDNRRDSDDSHIWEYLPRKNVKAKVFFRFWPLKRAGIVR